LGCAVVPCMPAFEWGGVHLPGLCNHAVSGGACGFGLGSSDRSCVVHRGAGFRGVLWLRAGALSASLWPFVVWQFGVPLDAPVGCYNFSAAAAASPQHAPPSSAIAFGRGLPPSVSKLGLSSACMRRLVGRPRGGVRALAACACGGRCGSCRSRHMSAFVVAGLLVCSRAVLHVCALPWCGG
jgi:hypothetical protein